MSPRAANIAASQSIAVLFCQHANNAAANANPAATKIAVAIRSRRVITFLLFH
jgi:hypothetical protein